MFVRKTLLTALASLLLLSACAAPALPQTAEMPVQTEHMSDNAMGAGEMMTATHVMTDAMAIELMTDSHMLTDTMAGELMAAGQLMTTTQAVTETTAGAMMALPAWQTMTLTDARTGASFTLADFAGKHVFVETMATWCSNCRQQLGNVKSAVARADGNQVVFVAISVETDLAPATLAQYATDNGFDWTFAVAPPALVRALADTFGPTVANPPATPHFLIQPDGAHGDLITGYESGDAILAQLGG